MQVNGVNMPICGDREDIGGATAGDFLCTAKYCALKYLNCPPMASDIDWLCGSRTKQRTRIPLSSTTDSVHGERNRQLLNIRLKKGVERLKCFWSSLVKPFINKSIP